MNKISLTQDRKAIIDISLKLLATTKNVSRTNRDLMQNKDADLAN